MVRMSSRSKRNNRNSSWNRLILFFLFSFLLIFITSFFTSEIHLGTIELDNLVDPTTIKIVPHQAIASNNNLQEGNHKVAKASPETNAKAKETIGYAISLTSCPEGDKTTLQDGAAILQHSIHLSSFRTKKSSSLLSSMNNNFDKQDEPVSQYDYQMYAIVHPSAEHCSQTLTHLGYKVLIKDVLVPVEEIQGAYLRENVQKNGCCGDLEYIKLHAYTLTDHPVVVHLDLDTVILQPLDALFDAMLVNDDDVARGVVTDDPRNATTLDAMWTDQDIPAKIDAFFTRDYNMVQPDRKHKGVQGGFLVLRPSMSAYEEYTAIIRKGDYRGSGGWGGEGFGPWYGALTFQGIVPYFYDGLHPGTAVELNRCVYNQMVDNPRDQRTGADNIAVGRCRDGTEDCEDCRLRGIDEVKTAHFTLCSKPWDCILHNQNRIQSWLCRELFGKWFRIRSDLELRWQGRTGEKNVKVVGEGKYDAEHFRGFCEAGGAKGYIPMKVPENALDFSKT